MNQIIRFFLVLFIACEMPSCVATYADPVVGGWEGPAAGALVGSATYGMVGYSGRPYYGGSYYGRPYVGAGYHARSYARGYHRPYVGARPGRF